MLTALSLGAPQIHVHHTSVLPLVALVLVGLAGAGLDLKRRQQRREVKPALGGHMPIEQQLAAIYPHTSPWAADFWTGSTKLSLQVQGYDPRGLPPHNWIGSDGTPVCYGRGCMCCR